MGKKYSKLNPKVISDIREKTDLTDNEILEWYRGFIEDYPEGTITIDEFQTIYATFFPCGDAQIFAEHVFRTFDKNNDHRIDFREFITGLSVMSDGSFEEKLEWAFSIYDIDSNGFISREEMLEIVTTMHKMVPINDVDLSVDLSTPEKRVDKIFRHMDVDQDNRLSLEEFIEGARSDILMVKLLQIYK